MKIGDEIYVHGCVDEIRKDCVIVKNKGGYFGTVQEEISEAIPPIDLREMDLWIPVSKRLPSKTGHYLCSFKEPHRIDNIFVDLAYWTGGRWYGYLANEIVAWQPLPKPYEVEE